MKYQKPSLHGISGDAICCCWSGSGATGNQLGTQCDAGGSPDVSGSILLCQNGSGDANDYCVTCATGTSYNLGVTACEVGTGVF